MSFTRHRKIRCTTHFWTVYNNVEQSAYNSITGAPGTRCWQVPESKNKQWWLSYNIPGQKFQQSTLLPASRQRVQQGVHFWVASSQNCCIPSGHFNSAMVVTPTELKKSPIYTWQAICRSPSYLVYLCSKFHSILLSVCPAHHSSCVYPTWQRRRLPAYSGAPHRLLAVREV